ncbi:DEAD/DEAH box helicase family protein [Nocardioides sp. NPDC057767]|uniref:DEAD/DEAH box helicase family protein n=1 Tax=unclassified Nocardioides TaxID=2615069 RepID=UPI00366ECC5D
MESDPSLLWTQVEQEIDQTTCAIGHGFQASEVRGDFLDVDSHGLVRLTAEGSDWLVEALRPSPDWQACAPEASSLLRKWQSEALNAWSDHGRHGVVEAVTGTGKSRVGVEAAREAIGDDYSVVVVVPTIDLVDQWVKTMREHGIRDVGAIGDGRTATLSTNQVIVGTVQSLYLAPPTRPDGKVLLIADECHRYGAGQWGKALHPSYRRRLGLTATFERNDDGLDSLLTYFGGQPIFKIGFGRAIDDGIVARYDVKLLGVELTPAERHQYDEADDALKEARLKLLSAGLPSEPFGVFLHAVQQAANDDDEPTVCEAARRYLKAFSERIDVMTGAWNKLNAMEVLTPTVRDSKGAIVFTRRVDMAEDLASVLAEQDVRATAVHSNLTRTERKERLLRLKAGGLKALVAPTVLDEGIDVPDIDLAIVMGGSKSRRQMIQRMGRVLRLKRDGRKATFIVVYAMNTAEDLTETDGTEGCLDLIVENADQVQALTVRDGALAPSKIVYRRKTMEQAPMPPVPGQPDLDRLHLDVDPDKVSVTQHVIDQYKRIHPIVNDETAKLDLEVLLRALLEGGTYATSRKTPGAFVLRARGYVLVIKRDRFVQYDCSRGDRARWTDLHPAQLDRSGPATVGEATTTAATGTRPAVPAASPFSAKATKSRGTVVRRPSEPVDIPFRKHTPIPADEVETPTPEPVPEPPSPAQPAAEDANAGDRLVDQLERLAALKKQGLLTDDEFHQAKKRLLG